jgi:hypothetical protein
MDVMPLVSRSGSVDQECRTPRPKNRTTASRTGTAPNCWSGSVEQTGIVPTPNERIGQEAWWMRPLDE